MRTNKSGKIKMRIGARISIIIICFILILLFSIFSGSLSFTQGPTITPFIPYTDDNLTCSWQVSPDTTQTNVSWYKNGALFNTTTTTENHSTIPPENTTKNEVWSCNVTITNGTDTASSGASTTIINSPPDEPSVFNSTGQDLGSFQIIYEDQIYNYDINSSDPDGDALTYRVSPISSFCSIVDENLGTVSCSPTSSHLGANNTIGQRNITFWADDTDPSYPKSTGHTVLFNITPINDNPQFSPALANQQINEGEVFNYYIYGIDEENNTPFNFSIGVNPFLSLIINATSSTSAIIMFTDNRTASYSEAGNYTVSVTLNDSQNGTVADSFTLEIEQINTAPVLENIPTQNGTQGQPFYFYIYANDADVNNTLNFSVTSTGCSITNPWSIVTLNNSRNATGLVNFTNLTNNHVICRNIRITVIDDVGAEDFQDVFLNISNTNDPPNVEVLSSYSNNTGGNNITNLTAYAESLFVYLVNATDIDTLTYEGEVLIYADNTSLFDINSSTGLIMFTPSQGDVENYTILINVSDDGGLIDSQIMNLNIINNTAPVLMSIGNLSCTEDSLCFFVINASDAEGDELSFTSNNTAVFSLTDNSSQSPVTSAYVNYTPDQEQVGIFIVIITVTDARGASDNETIVFMVNNTNDAPVLQSISLPSKVVEAHTASFYVYADDEDYELSNSYENVSFDVINISGEQLFNITTYLNSSNNITYGRVIFTPQVGDAGNYSVNITATDYYGEIDWEVKNFTVLAKTNPPNISQIMPYGKPYSNTTIFSFTSTSNYGDTLTSVNFSENRSVVYNITVADDTTAEDSLSYDWYINGSLNSTSRYLNLSYSFFTSGGYNITLVVGDDMYENSSWTWNVSVEDVNRIPLLINILENITINATTIYTDYLKKTYGVHFIDPDDDVNDNNDFDGGEVSNLLYNVTLCDVASITITNHSIRVEPEQEGTCTVYFTAIDSGGLTKISNTQVWINVTSVPNVTQEEEVTRHTGGGGGGGRSRSVVVPMTQEENKPKPIELVVPELVTIYENRTVLIPVTIKNNWNSTLKEITLNATTNESYVKLRFTEDYFNELNVGETKQVTLMVDDYRLGENYEVKISANVTTPKASDSALVMLNTIEQAEAGQEVETKVTFAQDLIRESPECMELNELLEEAKQELAEGSREEASRMVDAVINGCRYLVSVSKRVEQQPQSVINKFLKKENLKYFFIFTIIATFAILTMFVLKKKRLSREKEEKKEIEAGKKEEVMPYWPRQT